MTIQPIGVIDSGIGGLTVWRELIHRMPHETYLYFGDSGFCPYGSKTAPDITRRVTKIVDMMAANRCKLIVIACNAITAASIDFLRGHYPIPFVGMEPAVKPALLQTRTRAIGVLATQRTLEGTFFNRTKATYGQGITVIEQAGHGLVEKVEALDFDSTATTALLQTYLQPMVARNIDILVLGCTHYPFLEPTIRRILGHGIAIFNPASAVARHTANILEKRQSRVVPMPIPGKSIFYSTGNRQLIKQVLTMISPGPHAVRSIVL